MIALTVESAEPSSRSGRSGCSSAILCSTGARTRASKGSSQRTLSMMLEVPTTQPARRETAMVRIPYASWKARARE
jgi:hypothetical protein